MSEVLERSFRGHYGEVCRYLRCRTGDDARAEDLAQEVFEDAAAGLPDFGPDAPSPLPWLYTVAHRRFADEARRRRREAVAVSSLITLPAVEYDAELTGLIVAAFARLSEDQRRVLALKLLRGARFREVASELGISEGAARMRFLRALRALREDLEREGVQP